MKKIIYFSLFNLLFLSCTRKIPFTPELRNAIIEKRLDMQKIHFYNSSKIIITRGISADSAKLLGGKGNIDFKDGVFTQEITLKKGTVGKSNDKIGNPLGIVFGESEHKLYWTPNTNLYSLSYTDESASWTVICGNNKFKLLEGEEAQLVVRKKVLELLTKE